MEYITKEGIIDVLYNIGLRKGDTVFIHSNIVSFGSIKFFKERCPKYFL